MTEPLSWKTRDFQLPKTALCVTLHYEEVSKTVWVMWAEKKLERTDILKPPAIPINTAKNPTTIDNGFSAERANEDGCHNQGLMKKA